MRLYIVIVSASFLLLSIKSARAQTPGRIREYNSGMQFSFFPGISTNGINSGSYYNVFSINLFGGISAGTRGFEITPVTNVNLKKSNGLQIAGLANIIGANAFLNFDRNEQYELEHSDFSSDNQGILVAGMLNYVRNNSNGIQLSGGFNIVGDDFKGFAFALFGNYSGNVSGEYTRGLQLSGVFNSSGKSMYGTQISGIANKAGENFSGLQVSAYNFAERTKGKNSVARTDAAGIQLGLVNRCKSMEGIQIGVLNMGRQSKGLQVGIINIYRAYDKVDNLRKGTPVGLINIGSISTKFRFYYNEVFTYNFEFITGNCLNCSATLSSMPVNEKRKILNQNALIGSYDEITGRWGIGYGFRRLYYRKYSLTKDLRNMKVFNGFGLSIQHINKGQAFERSLSLLTKVNYDCGIRIKLRSLSGHLFGGISANYLLRKNDIPLTVRAPVFGSFWPGYSVGFQF